MSFSFEDDPLWYKDGVIYQLHIRSFFDSSNDGTGDFGGLARKLDYLQNLGVTALWLLPFYPSPMKDDGYDIADYKDVNSIYGNLRDFKVFLHEAHRRGLRVITELVINHTSDQHPWFQRARRAPAGSRVRDFYVWSDTANRYPEARIIFKDFEPSNWSWDPIAKAYYWHRFYRYQPDLNFDNPDVREAVLDVLDFWMKTGVDGVRLDAIPYLYERDGTNCENLSETHELLKEIRRHVDEHFSNRMLLAEANQWPEDAIAYFGSGDECHVAFHFPLMPRLFMSLAMEDRFPIEEIMEQTPPIPESCQWALFLRNHDELTLEMVTDEDRDYMWKSYARDPQARINLGIRRRLAPLLGNHRGRIELLNGLLFSFPGTPIIYYGDEIGMGDNIYLGDRNGVRTPMQWSSDRNAGFSRANPQQLFLPIIIDPEYNYEAVNVETQQNNPHSLLWWTKRLIDLRKRYRAFGRGTMEFVYPKNRKILAFLRKYQNEQILVVANLSRFVQPAELDLSKYEGMMPVELIGRTPFPPITKAPYFITLGPHSFFWFSLEHRDAALTVSREIPHMKGNRVEDLFKGRNASPLANALLAFIRNRPWFGGTSRPAKLAKIIDLFPDISPGTTLVVLQVEYSDGIPELYQIPVAVILGAERVREHDDIPVIARVATDEGEGAMYEAFADKEFCRQLLRAIGSRKHVHGEAGGSINGVRTRVYQNLKGLAQGTVEPEILKDESNLSMRYGQSFFLKLFRKLETGVNSDFEINRFLTEKTEFEHVAPVAGALEYRIDGAGEPATMVLLQKFVPNGGNAWTYTLDTLRQYFDRCMSDSGSLQRLSQHLPTGPLTDLARQPVTGETTEILGNYLEAARLLGQRTAELHAALSSRDDIPDFRPEPFTQHYQRSVYQQVRRGAAAALAALRARVGDLAEPVRADAEAVLAAESRIQARVRELMHLKISATRIRLHGEFHMGQVLQTGKDFVIIDFEGEPGLPLSLRRIKRNALRDVASMLRSFHHAPYAVLLGSAPGTTVRTLDVAALETAADYWHRWVSAIYLGSYLETARDAAFVPQTREELSVLLDVFLLERMLDEVTQELTREHAHPAEWLRIPLRGILEVAGGW